MTENRDFLAEFEQLRVETDGIRDALVSKTAHFNNLVFDNGIFKVIMDELKEIRKENKENQDKNEKKFEELKKELLEQNLKIEQKIEENQDKNEKKLEEIKLELKTEFLEQNLRMQQKMEELKNEIVRLSEKKIPIRDAVLGEWKMIEHENFEEFENWYKWTFEEFSENLKFEMVDGKLKQSGSGYSDIIEGEHDDGMKFLYVENDHLKSFWPSSGSTDDFYIENGKLHYVGNWEGVVFKRIYEKI